MFLLTVSEACLHPSSDMLGKEMEDFYPYVGLFCEGVRTVDVTLSPVFRRLWICEFHSCSQMGCPLGSSRSEGSLGNVGIWDG